MNLQGTLARGAFDTTRGAIETTDSITKYHCAFHWSPLQIHCRFYLISFITFLILNRWHLIFYLITIESILSQSISKFLRYLLGSSIVSLDSTICM